MTRISEWGKAAFRLLPAVLFPPACLGCRRQVVEAGCLCGECWSGVRFIEEPVCPVFGTPFSHEMGDGFLSVPAIADPPPFERARAAAIYDGVARDMVLALKFRDRTEMAPWMARWMIRAGRDLLSEADLIAAIPLHRRRFMWRRFNQAAELARSLSAMSGRPFAVDLLQRRRPTRQQVGLPSSERRDNVRGAFVVPQHLRPILKGRRVVLVDDVYTTGATVIAATRTLMKAGAGAVDVLTFARVVPGDFQRSLA